MENMKYLQEQRAELVEQMETLVETAKTETRAMSTEEIDKFNELDSKIKEIDATIEIQNRSFKEEIKESEETRMSVEKLNVEEREIKEFADFLRSGKVENRADSTMVQGDNGAVVPQTIADQIIKEVRDRVPFLQLAKVVYANGKLSFPVYNDSNEADYVDEASTVDAKSGAFTTVDLTGYVIMARSIVSNKLVRNTDFDLVSFVVSEIADKIANKLEKEFITGTSKIQGILSAPKTVTAATAAGVTYDELLTLKHSIKKQFRDNGVFIMNDSTYTAISKLKDENGQPYFSDDDNYTILGRPVVISDSMPEIGARAKSIVFADLSGYAIKMAKQVETKVLNEKYAEYDSTGVLGLVEVDGRIIDSKKISVLQHPVA